MPASSLVRRGPISVNTNIEVLPAKAILVGQFAYLSLSFTNFKEPLTDSIKLVVIPSINQNFADEGRPEPWAELADYTLSRREDEGFGAGPILERTGKLHRAATAFARWKITTTEAAFDSFTSTQFYGYIMQEGSAGFWHPGGKVSGEIPARPFILVQDDDVDKIEAIFTAWIKSKLEVAGFTV